MQHITELKAAGHSVSYIAHTLDLSRNTVKKYLRDSGVPQAQPRRRRGSKLDAHIDYLHERLQKGIYSAVVLFRELQARGYTG